MAESNGEFRSCAVCGRSILRGERLSDYLTPEREEAGVCALCKPRAEAAGWVPAALAGTLARPADERRTRRLGALRERLAARAAEVAGATARRPREAPEPDGAAAPEPAAEPRAPQPLEAFNSSPEARKVAGLIRSLGEPRVTVRADGAAGALITVAWELSWYQWRVAGGEVREVAKGAELSELAEKDRRWNAAAAEDGRLRVG